MKFTGERVIPGQCEPDLLNEHIVRYLLARQFAADKTVLDAACGAGYGSALLGERAAGVVGIDISGEAIEYARERYGSGKVRFLQSDCLSIPFPSGHFQLIAAFEIIEHLENPEAFVKELHRLLDASGVLLISTPNRLYYTEERGEKNPFHHRELSYEEFDAMLQPLFPHRAMLLENHVPGLLLSRAGEPPDFGTGGGVIIQEQAEHTSRNEPSEAHYFIAICSERPLGEVHPILYLPGEGNVLREREKHIHLLTEHLEQARRDTEQARADFQNARAEADRAAARMREMEALLEERTRWGQDLDRQLAEKGEHLLRLQAELDDKVQWALSLNHELETARAALQQLRHEFEDRTAWALRLDAELKERSDNLRLVYSSLWYKIGRGLRLGPSLPFKANDNGK